MARRVFFAFHYERDIWRASQVRNSWVTKPDRKSAGFWDAADWEKVKKQGDDAIKRWINSQLEGTSVTVVLIGSETADRDWVKYEIKRSYQRGNGMLGVYIHNMKDINGFTDTKGSNPFANLYVDQNGKKVYLSDLYPTYDWANNNGYQNLGSWIEEAAKKAGK